MTRISRPWVVNQRLVGLAVFGGAVVLLLAYLVVNVPLSEPKLSREEAVRHWGAALVAALIVLFGALAVVAGVLLRQPVSVRAGLRARLAGWLSSRRSEAVSGGRVPSPLTMQRVPDLAIGLSVFASLSFLVTVTVTGQPLWVGGVAVAVPWLPLIIWEGAWKYRRYGIFGAFAALVLLQVLHMGEHGMQVGQLMYHHGDLTRSHGVFGQLDFELVHFVTDTTLWLTLGLLLVAFYSRNKWLWVAFAAASLHQVEHFYLFWMYNSHEALYSSGGFAGIMGDGGMIGSPLERPYLHFTYNLIVVVPMILALWDEARRLDRYSR